MRATCQQRELSRAFMGFNLALMTIGTSASAQESSQVPPAAVRVAPVRIEHVEELRIVSGDLRAVRHAQVATQDAGLVLRAPMREGQSVEKGELMAALDTSRLGFELARAQADRFFADGVVSEWEAKLNQASRELEMMRSVFESSAANNKELLDAETTRAVAAARLGQSRRQVESIEARIELLRDRIEDARIVAPFGGFIVAGHVEEGEWIREGEPVVDLLAVEELEAWLTVPQEYMAFLRRHENPIQLHLDATSDTFSTTAWRIVPRIDLSARTFTLIATVANEHGDLAPGMSVVGWVPTGISGEFLLVPKNAVLTSDAGPYVYAVQRGSPPRARHVPVQMLFPKGREFVVRSDSLAADALVVVEGNERLFPMAPISPVEEPSVAKSQGQ